MHAFNFKSGDEIQIQVGKDTIVRDQPAFAKIKSGSIVQVSKRDHGNSCAYPFKVGNSNEPLRINTDSLQNETTDDEAALALAALSG